MGRLTGIKNIFCFLLFASPFVEYIIPGGDLYLASMVGIAAFAGVLQEMKSRNDALAITGYDLLFMAYLLYVVSRMSQPVDTGLCIKLLAALGIWLYARRNATAEFQRKVAGWMVIAGGGQAIIGLLQGSGLLESFHSGFAMTGTFGNPGPFGGYLVMVFALLLPYMSQGGLPLVRRVGLFVCLILVVAAGKATRL